MKTNTNKSLSKSTQKKDKPKYEKCNQCNRRNPLKSHRICQICYRSALFYRPSGNKIVDDFIRNSQINNGLIVNMMEFVPYDQFKDIDYIAKFESYEATWIEGNIQSWNNEKMNFKRSGPMQVVLKRLNDSDNITSKELSEVLYILI